MIVAIIGLVGATLAARLLGPERFGEYFLALTIVSVVGIAADLCVGQAVLTRSPGYEELWKGWRSLSITVAAVAATGTLAATIPFWMRGDQALMWALLCCGVPLTIASMVPRAFLVLNGQLRAIACIDVASILLANTLMIFLVLVYENVAAAAAGQVVIAATRLCALEFVKRHIGVEIQPQQSMRRREAFRSLWRVVGGVYQSQLAGFVARNGDNVLVSATLGPMNLAQYSRAYSLLLGPLQQAQMALTPMTLRDLAHQGGARRKLREGLKAAKFLLSVMLPTTAVVGVCGERLVFVILGAGWEPAASLMSASAGLAISMTLALPGRWILIAERNHKKLRIDSAMQYSLLLGVLIGSFLWGLQGSMSLNAVIIAPLTALTAWLLLPNQFRRPFWTEILPLAAILSAIPAAITFGLNYVIESDPMFIVASTLVALLSTAGALTLVLKRLV